MALWALLVAGIYFGTSASEANEVEFFKNARFADDIECTCGPLHAKSIFFGGKPCCETKPTNDFNHKHIINLFQTLSLSQYFRYYKVDLYRPCLFWEEDGICTVKSCSVNVCDTENLPLALQDNSDIKEDIVCSEGLDIGLDHINKSISDDRKYFLTKENHEDTPYEDIVDQGYDPPQGEYVDLQFNPERFTGYTGKSSRNIWTNIYGNNCFMDEKTPCQAQRVFQRMISGLHTSITIHLVSLFPQTQNGVTTWGLNKQFFEQRFLMNPNVSQSQEYIKNLYLLNSIMTRAIIKGSTVWNNMEFYTGDKDADSQTKSKVQFLVEHLSRSPSVFQEANMFSKNMTESLYMQDQIRHRFLNISRIMDCVGCDKCRLWGKLQTHGIGTALKILFSDPNSIVLKRMEIVALFNAANRYSNSLENLRNIENIYDSPNKSDEL